MRSWYCLIPSLLLTGCAGLQTYQGPKKAAHEVGKVFTHHRPNLQWRSVDGKEVHWLSVKVLEMLPGKHSFTVEASDYFVEGVVLGAGGYVIPDSNYEVATYLFDFDVQPNFSYMVDYSSLSRMLPTTLCVLGEESDAPGGKVNATGEYRTMSANARKIVCVEGKNRRRVGK